MRTKTLHKAKIIVTVEGNNLTKKIKTIFAVDNRTGEALTDEYIKERGIENFLNMDDMKETLNYDLEAKNYTDLIKMDLGSPRILIVYSLPKERDKWLEMLSDGMVLHKCAWWCSLRGQDRKKNKSKVRIEIPENQVLTSEELIRLIQLVKGGTVL